MIPKTMRRPEARVREKGRVSAGCPISLAMAVACLACLPNLVNYIVFQGPAYTAPVEWLADLLLSLPAHFPVCSARPSRWCSRRASCVRRFHGVTWDMPEGSEPIRARPGNRSGRRRPRRLPRQPRGRVQVLRAAVQPGQLPGCACRSCSTGCFFVGPGLHARGEHALSSGGVMLGGHALLPGFRHTFVGSPWHVFCIRECTEVSIMDAPGHNTCISHAGWRRARRRQPPLQRRRARRSPRQQGRRAGHGAAL